MDDPFKLGADKGKRISAEDDESRRARDDLQSSARRETQELIQELVPKFQGRFFVTNTFEGVAMIRPSASGSGPVFEINPAGEYRAAGYTLVGGGHRIRCVLPGNVMISEECASRERVSEVAGMFFGSWNDIAKGDGKPIPLWERHNIRDGTWEQKGSFFVKRNDP